MSAYVRSRANRDGTKSYTVVYRRGGRAHPKESAGTFKVQREARLRRDLVAGWLAIGLDPRDELAQLAAAPARPATFAERAASYLGILAIDLSEGSLKVRRSQIEHHLVPTFGHRDPATITTGDVQEWIAAEAAAGAAPTSIRAYHSVLATVLDHCDLDPNPARSKKLRLPALDDVETVPPPNRHVLAMLDRLASKWQKPFVVIEQTGVRVGETEQWTLGDVDWDDNRILSRPEYVKGKRGRRKARWVQVPEWLLDLVADDLPPPDDRTPETRLFPGYTHDGLRSAMRAACQLAKVPLYSPHDLRHRRISLWHGQGIPARDIGDRVGQGKISTTLDLYTHTMPLEELDQADLEPRLRNTEAE